MFIRCPILMAFVLVSRTAALVSAEESPARGSLDTIFHDGIRSELPRPKTPIAAPLPLKTMRDYVYGESIHPQVVRARHLLQLAREHRLAPTSSSQGATPTQNLTWDQEESNVFDQATEEYASYVRIAQALTSHEAAENRRKYRGSVRVPRGQTPALLPGLGVGPSDNRPPGRLDDTSTRRAYQVISDSERCRVVARFTAALSGRESPSKPASTEGRRPPVILKEPKARPEKEKKSSLCAIQAQLLSTRAQELQKIFGKLKQWNSFASRWIQALLSEPQAIPRETRSGSRWIYTKP